MSTGNQRQLRYSEEVKQFWRIGMKMFHGTFLRFMSGEKSVMNLASEDLSSCSRLNFSVPFKPVLQANPQYNPGDMKPDALYNILDAIPDEEKEQTFKLCVDGKKLNMSAASKIGGIDLFGFEDSPTAAKRAERIAQEDTTAAKVLDILTLFEEEECDSKAALHLSHIYFQTFRLRASSILMLFVLLFVQDLIAYMVILCLSIYNKLSLTHVTNA